MRDAPKVMPYIIYIYTESTTVHVTLFVRDIF